jgi:hypothetical protein
VYATNKTGSGSVSTSDTNVTRTPLIRRVLVRMIGFIIRWLQTHSHLRLHTGNTVLFRLHSLQSTVAHALGFSVSTNRFPATDLDAETVSLTLQIFHVNLLVTEAVFSTHADNSL